MEVATSTSTTLIKHLESIADEAIPGLDIGTGEVYVYQVDTEGRIISKEIRVANPNLV
ncbi:MAG TPA: hypothetical protein VFC51_11905 [Chloroflexota bacterium]|nr:hypothetical protein [Chloroflexota bacterium]